MHLRCMIEIYIERETENMDIYIYIYICSLSLYTHTHTYIYIYIYICWRMSSHTHVIYMYIYCLKKKGNSEIVFHDVEMFWDQNEDTQTREVGWNKYITITEQIYKIQVLYHSKECPSGTVRQLGDYRYLSSFPPTGRVWHKAFLGGSGRRAVAQTRPAFPKMPRAPSAFP